jgi:hypothetical protein
MPITRPTSDQIRFTSANVGDVILDAYLEAAERGGRSLGDLLSDLFDTNGSFYRSSGLYSWEGNYAYPVPYSTGDTFRVASTGNIYVALRNFTSTSNIATHTGNGDAALVFDAGSISTALADAQAAAASATAAAISATNAAASINPADLVHISGTETIIGTKIFTAPTTINVNNASTALKVIQTGSGPSFVVEDQVTDTTPFYIGPDGNVGIGTDTPAVKLNVQGNIRQSAGQSFAWNNGTHNLGSVEIDNSGVFHLRIGASGNIVSRVQVAQTGEVGIGAAAQPGTIFDVSGAANVDSLLINGSSIIATAAQINQLTGVSSNIQSQLDSLSTLVSGKQATLTGAATTIATSNLTLDRALISNGSGKVAVSPTTSTQLGYLSTATSNIQDQLDTKQQTITGAATTVLFADLATNRVLTSSVGGKIAASSITATQLFYLDGVTSDIQGQLNGISTSINTLSSTKLDVASPTFTGTQTGPRLRTSATTSVSLASTNHGLQVGESTVGNIAMDANTIQARNNGAAANLSINPLGGSVILPDNTVTTANIQAMAVTTGKINDAAVTSAKINDGAVTAAKLASAAARTNIADASVGQIGTFAFLKNTSATVYAPGDSAPAANLRYSTAGGTELSSPTPNGTWTCMGNGVNAGVTLWLRSA